MTDPVRLGGAILRLTPAPALGTGIKPRFPGAAFRLTPGTTYPPAIRLRVADAEMRMSANLNAAIAAGAAVLAATGHVGATHNSTSAALQAGAAVVMGQSFHTATGTGSLAAGSAVLVGFKDRQMPVTNVTVSTADLYTATIDGQAASLTRIAGAGEYSSQWNIGLALNGSRGGAAYSFFLGQVSGGSSQLVLDLGTIKDVSRVNIATGQLVGYGNASSGNIYYSTDNVSYTFGGRWENAGAATGTSVNMLRLAPTRYIKFEIDPSASVYNTANMQRVDVYTRDAVTTSGTGALAAGAAVTVGPGEIEHKGTATMVAGTATMAGVATKLRQGTGVLVAGGAVLFGIDDRLIAVTSVARTGVYTATATLDGNAVPSTVTSTIQEYDGSWTVAHVLDGDPGAAGPYSFFLGANGGGSGSVTIDMGVVRSLTRVFIQDGSSAGYGPLSSGTLETSVNGSTWTAGGSWTGGQSPNGHIKILMPLVASARYVRFNLSPVAGLYNTISMAKIAMYTQTPATSAVTGSGTLTASAAVAIGSGTRRVTVLAAFNAGSATLAGSGAVGHTITGYGVLSAGAAAIVAPGEVNHRGAGTLIAGSAVMVGSGAASRVGGGTVQASSATMSGAGDVGHKGSGALAAGSAVVLGSGGRVRTGSGTLTAGSAVVTGSGLSAKVATGSLQAGSAAVVSTGEIEHKAAGALYCMGATMSGSGVINHAGSGALQATIGSLLSFGKHGVKGQGILIAGAAVIEGVAGKGPTGQGNLMAQLATMYGYDSLPDTGILRAGRAVLVASGSVGKAVVANGLLVLPAAEAEGYARTGGAVTANLDTTLPGLHVDAHLRNWILRSGAERERDLFVDQREVALFLDGV